MPDIENLMQEWQPPFEETLKEVRVHEIEHTVFQTSTVLGTTMP